MFIAVCLAFLRRRSLFRIWRFSDLAIQGREFLALVSLEGTWLSTALVKEFLKKDQFSSMLLLWQKVKNSEALFETSSRSLVRSAIHAGDLNFRRDRSKEQFAPWGRDRVVIGTTKLTTLG